ncbi:hypothetical protein JCM8208_003491 [Rhodotorula glutinis]
MAPPPGMDAVPLAVPPPLREFSLEQLQAALVGQLFVGIVYATHVLSTIQYYRKFGGRDGDKKSVQLYVGCALFLGTAFAAINTAVSWRWLTHAITFGYTDLVVRNSDVIWTWTLGAFTTTTEAYWVWRVYRVSRQLVVRIVAVALMAMSSASFIALSCIVTSQRFGAVITVEHIQLCALIGIWLLTVDYMWCGGVLAYELVWKRRARVVRSTLVSAFTALALKTSVFICLGTIAGAICASITYAWSSARAYQAFNFFAVTFPFASSTSVCISLLQRNSLRQVRDAVVTLGATDPVDQHGLAESNKSCCCTLSNGRSAQGRGREGDGREGRADEVGSGLSSGSAYSLRPVPGAPQGPVRCARCGRRREGLEAGEKSWDGRGQVRSSVLTTVGSLDEADGGLDRGVVSQGTQVGRPPDSTMASTVPSGLPPAPPPALLEFTADKLHAGLFTEFCVGLLFVMWTDLADAVSQGFVDPDKVDGVTVWWIWCLSTFGTLTTGYWVWHTCRVSSQWWTRAIAVGGLDRVVRRLCDVRRHVVEPVLGLPLQPRAGALEPPFSGIWASAFDAIWCASVLMWELVWKRRGFLAQSSVVNVFTAVALKTSALICFLALAGAICMSIAIANGSGPAYHAFFVMTSCFPFASSATATWTLLQRNLLRDVRDAVEGPSGPSQVAERVAVCTIGGGGRPAAPRPAVDTVELLLRSDVTPPGEAKCERDDAEIRSGAEGAGGPALEPV